MILLIRRWNSTLEPFTEPMYASLLLADISGFTRLSSRLSAEELKFHIKLVVSSSIRSYLYDFFTLLFVSANTSPRCLVSSKAIMVM